MKTIHTLLAVASLAMLTACGGRGDDTAGDRAADRADAQADALDQQADVQANMGNDATAESLENQADAVRDAGKAQEEAIDDADVNATETNTTNTTAQ